jgi:dTMP kinase
MDGGKQTWISIDGVEAAGKTTLVNVLRERFEDVLVVDEFGDDPVGRFLRETVKHHPHVYSESLVGQSLVFLGEFWQRFDSLIRPALTRGAVVLCDRGYLSKYVYQFVVMKPSIGEAAAHSLLAAVFQPMPEPTLTVVLSAPIELLRARAFDRGESWDDEWETFVKEASSVFASPPLAAGALLSFDTSQMDPGAIADVVLSSF